MMKRQVVWTGSRKRSQVRLLRDMNFCWDPGIFTCGIELYKVTEIQFVSDRNKGKGGKG